MRRWCVLAVMLLFASLGIGGVAVAGPSGSTECHLQDDDCDGTIDEDTGNTSDDQDGDGLIDEDPVGDANADGNVDDDGDGLIDEDVPDDDNDGLIDEDPVGDATDNDGENEVDCSEGSSTDVGGVAYVYAGSDGAEVCADDSSAFAIDGSATIDTEEGYVAIDGDNSNAVPLNGYVRVDESGVHCGDENNQDSGAAQGENTSSDCG